MHKYFGIFKVYINGDYSYLTWKICYRENVTEAKKVLLDCTHEDERIFWEARQKTKNLELVHVELANERTGNEILIAYEQEFL